jgi:uncharacterized protein YjiS (DUF1127 family)
MSFLRFDIMSDRLNAEAVTPSANAGRPSFFIRFHKIGRGLRDLAARFASSRKYRREVEQLRQLDDRILKDIGLTRSDLVRMTLRTPEDLEE